MDLPERLKDPAWQAAYREAVAADVSTRAKEAAEWQEACRAGDCPYAKRQCRPPAAQQPIACLFRHHHGCPGYVGVNHLEHGRPLMRYELCPRQKQWWNEERARAAKRKAAAVAAKKPKPEGW